MGLNKGRVLSIANFTSNRPWPAKLTRECVTKHTRQQPLEETENLKNPGPCRWSRTIKLRLENSIIRTRSVGLYINCSVWASRARVVV